MIALILTSGALAALHTLDPSSSRVVEIAVLSSANVASTLVKFLLFRSWVFRPPRSTSTAEIEA